MSNIQLLDSMVVMVVIVVEVAVMESHSNFYVIEGPLDALNVH